MKQKAYVLYLLLGLMLISKINYAQEEESAEVFLEEYSDDFQENFFEALKQKGIENYDKAINLFLDCKQIEATNTVVDHELAKVYMQDKKYTFAQEHAIIALNASPENLWYLSTLVMVLKKQGITIESIKTSIPYKRKKLQENLALIYYQSKNYQKALNILKGIKESSFTKTLTVKIEDSLKQVYESNKRLEQPKPIVTKENPLTNYKNKIEGLLAENNYISLESITAEALENYPSQPYFYYAHGLSLNKNAKHKKAISILQEALDYILDDVDLTHKIYGELANAYTALGNSSKANMYLSKIKK